MPRTRRHKPAAAEPDTGKIRIRHYCQGIGDCHLLRFPRTEGDDFHMLIDCGVHPGVEGGADRMRKIVADIGKETQNRVDVLVVTHEHMDHVSGFLSAAEGFDKIEVGEVWFGWTENPDDPQATALDKFKADAAAALALTGSRLHASSSDKENGGVCAGLDAIMGFYFGAKGEKVRAARNAARSRSEKVIYYNPGDGPLTLPGVEGIRVYVLGPPRDVRQLRLDYRASEVYGSTLGFGPATSRSLMMALGCVSTDEDAPFDPEIGLPLSEVLPRAEAPASVVDDSEANAADLRAMVELLRACYTDKDAKALDQRWRRIDEDQFAMSAELAMQLDRMTNNCSLVLAFEYESSGRVLLFAGDAQVGSWLSWQDLSWNVGDTIITGPDLLARTVYLKVAHHGSHNATLKEKGLELMRDRDLSAFIPVNAEDAMKIGWKEMPFDDIVKELDQRSFGRVIRADDPWVANSRIPPELAVRNGSIQVVGVGRKEDLLWVELDIV